MITVVLPFPPSSLSGHTNGHWRAKAAITKQHRNWACLAAMSAMRGQAVVFDGTGDIRLTVHFTPPDRRGDRTNYANRCKPYFDGIADGLDVNDKRFLPVYHYDEPAKPGYVTITLESAK